MLDVAQVIFETAKIYLIQQGKFLAILFFFIGSAVAFYFGWLSDANFGAKGVLIILGWTVVGILGSYSVAWFGIRMNTLANSRITGSKSGMCSRTELLTALEKYEEGYGILLPSAQIRVL